MTATGGTELEQLARATKAVIGLRIFFRERKQPQLIIGFTTVFTDAQAVLDGTMGRTVQPTLVIPIGATRTDTTEATATRSCAGTIARVRFSSGKS